DDPAGAQEAALLGILDDEECRPILDRPAGVEELGLAEDRAPGLLGGAPQFDQRRVADRADKAVADLHATLPTPGSAPRLSAARERTQHSCNLPMAEPAPPGRGIPCRTGRRREKSHQGRRAPLKMPF